MRTTNLSSHLRTLIVIFPPPAGKPRCHFFNTFFYNALFADARSYNYGKVKRWTTPKRLGGYSILDCDKVVVPIHQQEAADRRNRCPCGKLPTDGCSLMLMAPLMPPGCALGAGGDQHRGQVPPLSRLHGRERQGFLGAPCFLTCLCGV
eukprot:5672951-Pyramimonas_sp.AAC.1